MLDEPLQLRAVARDLPHEQGQEEDNLLIEAVSLLVQRQREAETWLAEQMDQAHERSVAAERHYADLETRLAGIEDQLDRLVRELEPGRGDAVVGQRLARLREQVEDLKSDPDGRPLRSVPPAPPRALEAEAAPAPRSAQAEPAPQARALEHEASQAPRPYETEAPSAPRGYETEAPPARRGYEHAGSRPPRAVDEHAAPPRGPYAREAVASQATRPQTFASASASLLELLGPTPQDRFGVVLIFLGVVAVLYAVLTQLRLG